MRSIPDGRITLTAIALLAMKEGEFLFVPGMAGRTVGSKARWAKQKTGRLFTYRVMQWDGVAGVGVWRAKPPVSRPRATPCSGGEVRPPSVAAMMAGR